jgi:hypothetical protein
MSWSKESSLLIVASGNLQMRLVIGYKNKSCNSELKLRLLSSFLNSTEACDEGSWKYVMLLSEIFVIYAGLVVLLEQ